jgi:phage gp36-like protein
MSAYGIVPSDLDVRLSPVDRVQLTDSVTAPTGVENTTITQSAIDNAEVKLHGYAGKYYAIPIVASGDATIAEAAALTALVKRMIIAIAAYDLMARKPEWLESQQSNYWAQLNKETLAWLQGLSDKARPVVLPGAFERAVQIATSGGAAVSSDSSLFGRSSGGYSDYCTSDTDPRAS